MILGVGLSEVGDIQDEHKLRHSTNISRENSKVYFNLHFIYNNSICMQFEKKFKSSK